VVKIFNKTSKLKRVLQNNILIMKLLIFICIIINLFGALSIDISQSTQASSAVNPKITESSRNPEISNASPQTTANPPQTPTKSSTINVSTISFSTTLQSTTVSTQITSTLNPQTTKSPQSQSTTPSILQASQISTNNQEITTQNPDIPTRNPQSPSRPWDCSKFRITYLPQKCCSLPKLQISQKIIDNCKNECKNRHCCVVECKYREMGIYKNKEFSDQALLTAYKNSFVSDAEKTNWTNALNLSLNFCESIIMSVTTLRTTTVNMKKNIFTMTTSSRAKLATLKGTGQSISTKSVESTTITTSTTLEMTTSKASSTTSSTTILSTESVKDRRDKNLYCNIPVYVYLMISCTKVQSFINCPNFRNNDEVCDEWRDFLRKCRYELGFQL